MREAAECLENHASWGRRVLNSDARKQTLQGGFSCSLAINKPFISLLFFKEADERLFPATCQCLHIYKYMTSKAPENYSKHNSKRSLNCKTGWPPTSLWPLP